VLISSKTTEEEEEEEAEDGRILRPESKPGLPNKLVRQRG
jgi:hypothetical protein